MSPEILLPGRILRRIGAIVVQQFEHQMRSKTNYSDRPSTIPLGAFLSLLLMPHIWYMHYK
jgi:hypothetical protein